MQFVVACTVGELACQGRASRKKVARQEAAKNMLEIISKKHPQVIIGLEEEENVSKNVQSNTQQKILLQSATKLNEPVETTQDLNQEPEQKNAKVEQKLHHKQSEIQALAKKKPQKKKLTEKKATVPKEAPHDKSLQQKLSVNVIPVISLESIQDLKHEPDQQITREQSEQTILIKNEAPQDISLQHIVSLTLLSVVNYISITKLIYILIKEAAKASESISEAAKEKGCDQEEDSV